ncbi:MAG: hypothetical protein ACI97A_003647 [Planctomycetota bacterium]
MKISAIRIGIFLLGLVLVASDFVRAQTVINQSFTGSHPGGGFGTSPENAGDVNGDGVNDVIVGAPSHGISGGAQSSALGAAFVFSGATGMRLYRKLGTQGGHFFGDLVAGAGDLNNDGFGDFLVHERYGLPKWNLFSGINGQLIRVFSYADGLVTKRDFDSDGIPDLVLGYPNSGPNGAFSGAIRVRSGIDNSLLYQINGMNTGARYGKPRRFDAIDDVDGDGVPDLAVIDESPNTSGGVPGSCHLYSGIDGTILHTILPIVASGQFFTVEQFGDFDQDGFGDLAILSGDTTSPATSFIVHAVYSGVDGAVLFHVNGASSFDLTFLRSLGDINGDGRRDFGVSLAAVRDSLGQITVPASLEIHSGLDQSILFTLAPQTPLTAYSFGQNMRNMPDHNGDGFDDLLIGQVDANGVFQVQIHVVPTLPILKYKSDSGDTSLELDWVPTNGSVHDLTGRLCCSGASPGSLGLYGVSLAQVDHPLSFGFPLLIANDPVNLLAVGSFGFDILGKIESSSFSRSQPGIAGSNLHMQFFESSPSFASSNAIRLLMGP